MHKFSKHDIPKYHKQSRKDIYHIFPTFSVTCSLSLKNFPLCSFNFVFWLSIPLTAKCKTSDRFQYAIHAFYDLSKDTQLGIPTYSRKNPPISMNTASVLRQIRVHHLPGMDNLQGRSLQRSV